MIKMTIYHGEEVQQRDLPCDFLSLRMSLYQMNLMRQPDEVSVRDVSATFESTDPIGQKLISLIRPGDLLADVDVAVHQLKAASQAIQEAMRQRLIDDDSMPQLCGKVLDKAVSELEKVDEDGNAFIVSVPIDSYLTEIWKSIGLSVFSWGCASDPVRS